MAILKKDGNTVADLVPCYCLREITAEEGLGKEYAGFLHKGYVLWL